ncbi:MAG TPA: DUF4337 family protein [Acidisphaera sp.]|nr:DUF4337 family protein [Acidisphaera sp.]
MTATKVLEHQEHAHHAFEHGAKNAAIVVAVLAALLAVSEQQAKHADIKVQTRSILAADAWTQYQAKSIRQLVSLDMAAMLTALEAPSDPALVQRRAEVIKRFNDDAEHFAKDPKDGKDVIFARARGFEEERDESLERAHSFDNAAAAFELGIVLATASAITVAKPLFRFALLMGAIGTVLAVLGWTAPQWGAF